MGHDDRRHVGGGGGVAGVAAVVFLYRPVCVVVHTV